MKFFNNYSIAEICYRKLSLFTGAVLLLFITGCASLNTERAVVFTDVSTVLHYKNVESDAFEKDGLRLRLYQQNKVLKYIDQLQVYTQITGEKGVAVNIDKTRKIIYSPGTSIDNFLITTETKSKDLSETSKEQLLMSNRGEIMKFITGEFQSQKGLIKILSWTRTPIFPEKIIKTGHVWSYMETIKIKLESFWITRNVEGPEKIKVNCKLVGFAELKGRRCAVIETQAVNSKNESYTALFKTMKLNIKTHITEKIFFDYKRGLEIGRISKTSSFTHSEDLSFSDVSRSQSISVITD